MQFETEVPKIMCMLNKERSKPPALAEKSKYLTINKPRNIWLFKIFSFQIIKNMHSGNNFSSLQNKTFKDLGVLGHLCK